VLPILFDYFTIGFRLAIRSTRPIFQIAQSNREIWSFDVLEPKALVVGNASVEPRDGAVFITLRWQIASPDAEQILEAIRLMATICRKVTPSEIRLDCGMDLSAIRARLVTAGFEQCGPEMWRYRYGLAPSASAKVDSVAECSKDPFQVPWNFEPRQWQILGRFLMEMGHTRAGNGGCFLEIGCGFGRNAVLLEQWNLNVHGIDVSYDAVRQCRRWVRHPERFVAASVSALPYPDDAFEGVLDVGCLHCSGTELLESAIDEIARVLRPSGRLYSRFFTPRNVAWLDAQPYRIDNIGLTPERLKVLLERQFNVTTWEEPDMTCVRAVRVK